jgi:uncharacterized protein
MDLEDAVDRLEKSRAGWDCFGVAALFIFGSVATGQAQNDSDVDVLVDFCRPIGLFEFAGLQDYLTSVLGHRVDLVTRAALKPGMRERVLAEAVRVA